jgi:ubiquinone/menaquinone biosynthesis C-methylase UbiE
MLVKIVAWVLLGLLVLHTLARLIRRFVKFPAPAIAVRLLASPWRLKLYPAATLIERSGIREGMHVLELGCGSGAYTPSVARAVGAQGIVAALDIQADMIAQLEAKLRQPENSDIENIETHVHSAYDLPFEDGTFDLVYTIAVLQEIPDKARALMEVHRVLKTGGILAVTELFQDPDWYYTIRFVKA